MIENITQIADQPKDEIKRRELFNIEAEQVILGTIILNNEYLNRVSDFLKSEHFYDNAHQKIYLKIFDLVETKNLVANQVTLKQFFENDEILVASGGVSYLAEIIARSSAIIDILDYGKIIYDLHLKRKLVVIGQDIVNNAYKIDDEKLANRQIEEAESELFNLSNQGTSDSGFQNIKSSLKNTIDDIIVARKRDSHISGVSTQLVDLDNILGGLQNSDLLILAGRPSMGKTALAITLAVNACEALNKGIENEEEKKAVGFFSLEMSSEQLTSRILSLKTTISSTDFRSGSISEDRFEAIVKAAGDIEKMPFFIDDTPALSIAAVRTRTRRLIRKHNLGVLFVDYLQLLRGSSKASEANRVQEISEITQGLKAIAKEFNIPVIALSQLSRGVEQREDKRPQLSDLRESGSIEQDADVVMFIFREAYYEERKRPDEEDAEKFQSWKTKMQQINNKSEVIIAKQRNGPVGSVTLYFDKDFARFSNMSFENQSHYES